jgi:hypothetical protein
VCDFVEYGTEESEHICRVLPAFLLIIHAYLGLLVQGSRTRRRHLVFELGWISIARRCCLFGVA